MLPPAVIGVIARHVFKQLDIARQPHAHVCAFDQIVTEQSLSGKSLPENFMERPHVINRLAVENRLAEQILLRV